MSQPIHDPILAPDAGDDARSTARQQFIHGLLSHLHAEAQGVRERRVRSVMSALEPVPAATAVSDPPRRLRWRPWSAVAAALALCAAVVYMVPGTPSALAMVETSLEAAAKAGDRRYEVRVPLPPDRGGKAGQTHAIATIDLRGTDRMIARATTPFGDHVAFGRDGAGAWSIRPDGTLDRLAAGRARPRWVELGESTILLDSTESLMGALKGEYDARRADPAPLPGESNVICDRITAVRRASPSPEPQRIEVWIDQQSHLPRRIELHWPEMGPRHGRSEGPGPDRDGRRGPRDRREMEGPPGLAPGGGEDGPPFPPPGPGPGRPSPRDDRDGPRMRPVPHGPGGPGEGGPDGPPPPRRGDRFGPGGPPPGSERPGPDGPPPPPRRGPRGPEGSDHADRPPPRFIDGRPDFGAGHAPPPQIIVFQMVPLSDGGTINDGWFSPEAHRAWIDEHNSRWPGAGEGPRPGGQHEDAQEGKPRPQPPRRPE